MDSHGAFASALLRRASTTPGAIGASERSERQSVIDVLVDGIKSGGSDGVSPKLAALLHVARAVQKNPRSVRAEDVRRALDAGASDADTQLAVLIASAFCMYNRMVDGLRAPTPPTPDAYRARAEEIAEHGYSDPRVQSLPR
jgi:hypothetical protein